MEKPLGAPASDVELSTLPPSYSSIFPTQSDEHGAAPTAPPYPMSMPMPMPISEGAQGDGNPMLEPVNNQSVVPNVSNGPEETVVDDTKEKSSSTCLKCIGALVFLIISIVVWLVVKNQLGVSSPNSSHRTYVHVRSRSGKHGHVSHGGGRHG